MLYSIYPYSLKNWYKSWEKKKFKMKHLLGMDLLVAVAVALAVIIMAPNEAVALGDAIGGISSIGLPKK
ncbi:hypothetical protein MRX96_039516 [Rhipicephalus microplus]